MWSPVGSARCLDKCVCVGPSWLCLVSRHVCLSGSQLAMPCVSTRVFVWVPAGFAWCLDTCVCVGPSWLFLDTCVCVGPSWLCLVSRHVCLCGSQLAFPSVSTRVCVGPVGYARCLDKCVCVGPSWFFRMISRRVSVRWIYGYEITMLYRGSDLQRYSSDAPATPTED